MRLCAVIFASFFLFACGSSSSSDKSETPQTENSQNESGLPLLGTASEQGAFRVSIEWSQPITAGTLENTATLHFYDAKGADLSVQLTRYRLYMISMGHGSIKEKDMVFTDLGNGAWKVENIFFSMGGPASSWVVDVEADVAGQADKARVSIDYEVH